MEGCVTTPSVVPYWVEFTLRSDGTYSAVSSERLDGQEMNAMYYGTEEDSPNKRWALNDIQTAERVSGRSTSRGPNTQRTGTSCATSS